MSITKAHQRGGFGSLSALHGHQQFLLTSTGGMIRHKARRFCALNTRSFPDVTNIAPLDSRFLIRKCLCLNPVTLTSFQRCFEILSAPVMGSMKTSLATRVSGIHIAHRRCTHSPCTVCLKAPPSFGQRKHDLRQDIRSQPNIWYWDGNKRTTGFSGETVHLRHNHWPSGIYGTP